MTPTPSRQLPADEPRAEWIYTVLRDRIVKGDGPPGERLREEDMAQRFGVSRTPVRQALHKLHTEGLVVNRLGRGLVVAELDHDEIAEIYVLREVLEGAATRLAATRALDRDVDRLDLIVAAIARATDARDDERVVQLNADFHAAIWQISGHRRLQKLLNDLKDAIQRFQRLTLRYPGRMEQSLEEHRELLEAIRRRDGAAAESLARAHMRQVANIRMMLGVMGESDWTGGQMRAEGDT